MKPKSARRAAMGQEDRHDLRNSTMTRTCPGRHVRARYQGSARHNRARDLLPVALTKVGYFLAKAERRRRRVRRKKRRILRTDTAPVVK
jgi:hypothetical protein